MTTHPHYAHHAPTWTRPVVPGMGLVARLAEHGARLLGGVCTGLDEVMIAGWLTVDHERVLTSRISGEIDGAEGQSRSAALELLVDGKLAAKATVHTAPTWPEAPAATPALTDGKEVPDPYEAGTLFHGPSFQALRTLRQSFAGESELIGASGMLDGRVGDTEAGLVAELLLDAATHVIPHDAMWKWAPEIPADQVAYPSRIPQIRFFGPAPTYGAVRVEARFLGFDGGNPRFPRVSLELVHHGADAVHATLELVEATFPKGPIGMAEPEDRRAFLTGTAVPGLRLSEPQADGSTRLDPKAVRASDWLPGTVAAAYGIDPTLPAAKLDEELLMREVVAASQGVHPREVNTGATLSKWSAPITRDGLTLVAGGPEQRLDLAPIQQHWTRYFDLDGWPTEDLYYGLIERFVRRVNFEDQAAFEAIHGRSVMYLANHQTMIESLLFSIITGAIGGVPTVTLAKIEHQETWLGQLIAHCWTWPGAKDPEVIAFFDRKDKASLPAIASQLAMQMAGPGKSVMVHIEGTRSMNLRQPVQKMSGMFIDMAIEVGAPVVPVRFTGGLPGEPMDARTDFPTGMGSQDIWFGTPLMPEELAGMPYGERKKRVIAAINGLGPSNAEESPNPADPAFEQAVRGWQAESGASEAHAVLNAVLREQASPCAPTQRLLEAVANGAFEADGSASDTFLDVLYGWLANR